VKKRAVEKSKINLLDLIPVRNIKWEKKEDGLIVLLKPKFEHVLLKKYVLPINSEKMSNLFMIDWPSFFKTWKKSISSSTKEKTNKIE